ncbi:MAG: cytochrome d ubiquinol oxidase subunit II [Neisseriales bacterium]|nr:MAG: cytochrome d ubiquinol oxidase subunit II [Neisseriales bacterium]
MLDYEILKVIWWLLVGILLIGFAIMDGHDMGVGTLLPFVGRNDVERRVVINTVGPHWDGNQVWFITGGGAIFAAWPLVYATAFSGFYWAMLAVLWALFFRPVSFDYRSKINHPAWRSTWDWCLFIGSAVPPVIFGVAFGNLLQGVPFYFDDNMISFYTGSFFALLNPFALLCGMVSCAMITFHGAIYLAHRTEGAIQRRAKLAAYIFGMLLLATFSLAGIWLLVDIDGYAITSAVDIGGVLNPTHKTVVHQTGAWLNNYYRLPITMAIPTLVYIGVVGALILSRLSKNASAFIFSALSLTGVIATVGVSMFPFIMPSSSHPNASLTVWDGTSSQLTLMIMLCVAVFFMPIILFYTGWAYRVMSGKVTTDYIHKNNHSTY